MGVIVYAGSINIQHLAPKDLFRGADIPYAGQQFIKVIAASSLFQPVVVQSETLNNVFTQPLGCPDAELRATNAVDPITYRDYGIQIVVFQRTLDTPGSLMLNCCKICNSCLST